MRIGWLWMAAVIAGIFYAAMVIAGYAVELIFGGFGLIPTQRAATVADTRPSWDYTTWLNIVFLLLATVLILRFVTTGGIAMLRMMDGTGHGGGDEAHDPHGITRAGDA